MTGTKFLFYFLFTDFQAENGREPTKEDKESIKDRFKKLKAETAAVATAKDNVDKLKGELEELNKRLEQLNATVTTEELPSLKLETPQPVEEEAMKSLEAPKLQEIVKVDMESQTDPTPVQEQKEGSPVATTEPIVPVGEEMEQKNDEMDKKIEELMEAIKKEQETIVKMQEEINNKEKIIIEVEEAFAEKEEELKSIQTQEISLEELKGQHEVEVNTLREQIDDLIAQKRTDVIKTLTEENKRLADESSANTTLIGTSTFYFFEYYQSFIPNIRS